MRVPKRDLFATGVVALAVALYVLWLTDIALPRMDGIRPTGAVLLGLGFVASVIAVVPGFDGLLHGNKAYLAVTVVLGLAALAGGLFMLISASEVGLAVLMSAMVVLWAIATTHHVLLDAKVHGRRHFRLAA